MENEFSTNRSEPEWYSLAYVLILACPRELGKPATAFIFFESPVDHDLLLTEPLSIASLIRTINLYSQVDLNVDFRCTLHKSTNSSASKLCDTQRPDLTL